MAKVHTFPEELLIIVFNSIDAVARLAQCRLVCKGWNEPATRVMLSKKISVTSEEQALQLYRHLFKDPRKTSLIKHLHFELDEEHLPLVIEHLLRLTFTPKIQKFTGFAKADKFFTTLFEIADNTASSFDQLQSLTEYTGESDDISSQQYLKFKGAVRTFTLEITKASSGNSSSITWTEQLKEFPNLSKFILEGYPDWLEGIDYRIKECHYIKTLILKDIDYGAQNHGKLSKRDVRIWIADKHVKKVKSLRTIRIEALCRAELIEYLLFKYPNVTDITIKGDVWVPTYNRPNMDQDNLNRILDAVRTVRQKHINLVLPENIKMKNVIEFATTRDEDIRFTIEQINNQSQLVMKIN
ncbi:hypothetical protein V8B55DRAFT_1573939 [Mucor lusitanicus]|uniref:F-box domain-containing protein n=2 Tax=Mucor circinelloides f. lusitanicus TaxID=29924 RepID=A0A168MBR9_MUCCL|nr:hypothetical protein FB192DRAFT_1455637 [Mucor lusitanicus]OAD04684.1 hypothetical protein MUCCIDRAFT_161407 [Mucor lusitanicus CBS 277.49]